MHRDNEESKDGTHDNKETTKGLIDLKEFAPHILE
jgi:hypothetical protein